MLFRSWTAEPNIIPYLEAWSHIGPMNLYSNILSYSKNIQNTNTLPEAVMNTSREYRVLTPGTYVLLVQNANISGARYDLLFKLRYHSESVLVCYVLVFTRFFGSHVYLDVVNRFRLS